jgi:hypothetical protein
VLQVQLKGTSKMFAMKVQLRSAAWSRDMLMLQYR